VNCTVLHCIPQSCTKIYRSRWTVRTDGCSFTLRFKFLCFSAYFCNRGLVFLCRLGQFLCFYVFLVFMSPRVWTGCSSDVRLLPVLWTRYFENKSTDFAANWHKWSMAQGMKQSTLGVRQWSRSDNAEVRSGGTGIVLDPFSCFVWVFTVDYHYQHNRLVGKTSLQKVNCLNLVCYLLLYRFLLCVYLECRR